MADAPKILGTDTLRQMYPKVNKSIDNANVALTKSADAQNSANTAFTEAQRLGNEAKSTADAAETKADSVQAQFNQVIIEGDSSVEAAQARVKADGTTYTTLRDRMNDADSQLAQNETLIKDNVINITSFGALRGRANDSTQLINEVANYCRQNDKILLIPKGTFYITGQLDLQDLSIVMDGKILVSKDYFGVAILVGGSSNLFAQKNRHIEINVQREAYDQTKTSTGVILKNIQTSTIIYKLCMNFGVGSVVTSKMDDGYTELVGSAWNIFHIVNCMQNDTNILINVEDERAFTNENTFYCGRLGSASTAIKITAFNGVKKPNHNVFIHPDFDFSNTGIHIEHGFRNYVSSARTESVTTLAIFENESSHNELEIGYSGNAYAYTDTSNNGTNRVYRYEDKIPLFSVLDTRSFKFSTVNGGVFTCPSFSIRVKTKSIEERFRLSSNLSNEITLDNGVLSLSNNIAVGINVDTTYAKHLVFRTYSPYMKDDDIHKKIVVIPFDINGNRLADSLGVNQYITATTWLSSKDNAVWSTDFGGSYIVQANTTDGKSPRRVESYLGISAEVAYVWIGVSSMSDIPAASVESIDILTYDKVSPKTWLGYDGSKLYAPNRYTRDIPAWAPSNGEYIGKLEPLEEGATGSKYMTVGWTGVGGVWLPNRVLTGN